MSSTRRLIKSEYVPDSINLAEDNEAADYWFQCFQDLAKKFSQQAATSSSMDDSSAESRSQLFLLDYLSRLDELKQRRK